MNFEIFSDHVDQLMQTIEKSDNKILRQLLLSFPWSDRDFFISDNHWGKSNLTAHQAISILAEIKATIYLCQGRFGYSYLKRQPCKRNVKQLLEEFKRISPTAEVIDLVDLYKQLNSCANLIFSWLDHKGEMPNQLANVIERIQSESARVCLAKILSGRLIDDRALIEFLAQHLSAKGMGSVAVKQIQKIYRTTLPNLGLIAEMLWNGSVWDVLESPLQLGLPTRPEKIRRFDKIDLVWSQTGPCFVQKKHNGWQVQLHKDGDRVRIFGRNLVDITERLSHLAKICKKNIQSSSTILDGEVVFGNLGDPSSTPSPNPHMSPLPKIIVFDLLYLDGEDVRAEAYLKRKRKLQKILPDISSSVHLAEEEFIDNNKQLVTLWNKYIKDPSCKGIVVKLPRTQYNSAGKSDGKWKIKNYLSLDFVVLGYRLSNNDRGIFLLGAWDEESHKYVPIGEIDSVKASYEVNRKILKMCKLFETKQAPPNVSYSVVPKYMVKPKVVVEVVTDGHRTKDKRYFNAAFSRLLPFDQKKYMERPDKSPEDANTLADFLALKLIAEDPEQRNFKGN